MDSALQRAHLAMESARKAKYYVETSVEIKMDIGGIVMATASTKHRHVMENVQWEASSVETAPDVSHQMTDRLKNAMEPVSLF